MRFGPSLRDAVASAVLLAFGTWLVLRLAFRVEPRAATMATFAALATVMALAALRRRGAPAIEVDAEGLRVRDGEAVREIAWHEVRRVRLATGDVATPDGTALVGFARVEFSHGEPLAFADLAPLGGAHVTLADGRTTVVDVGEPDVLLGIIAERVGAMEFLPPPGPKPRAAPPPRRLAGLGSTVVALRGAVCALLAWRVAAALWDASADEVAAATGGATAVVAVASAARYLAARAAGPRQRDAAALVALVVGLGAAVASARWAALGEHAATARWALAVALALALPAWPLPGAAFARASGAALARAGVDVVALGLLALVAAAGAALLARGMTLVPLALFAACAEAVEAHGALRRGEGLARAPRFAAWPTDALARLRARLRAAVPAYGDVDRRAALDLAGLARGEIQRRGAPPPAWLVAAAAGAVALAVFAAREDLRARRAAPSPVAVLAR